MRKINTVLLGLILIVIITSDRLDKTRHIATQTAIQELSNTITQKSKETAKSDTLKIKLKKELLVLLNDINEVQ